MTDTIRPTDEKALTTAASLVGKARHGALAFLEPGTGFPLASRIALCPVGSGQIVFLASDLSLHSQAIRECADISVLIGEPGRGDPLAHPRLCVAGQAVAIARNDRDHAVIRDRWLAWHPKSQLYVDFADFRFYRIQALRAFFNAGFGQAYHLTGEDLANLLETDTGKGTV